MFLKIQFSTYCSHFLTFSQLSNKYIILFILQYKNTNKTQKKISSNLVKLREEGRERGDWVRQKARSRDAMLQSQSARCCNRNRRDATITIDAMLQRSDSVQKGKGDRERERSAAQIENSTARSRHYVWGWAAAFVSRSFSLSFSLCTSVSSFLCMSQFQK